MKACLRTLSWDPRLDASPMWACSSPGPQAAFQSCIPPGHADLEIRPVDDVRVRGLFEEGLEGLDRVAKRVESLPVDVESRVPSLRHFLAPWKHDGSQKSMCGPRASTILSLPRVVNVADSRGRGVAEGARMAYNGHQRPTRRLRRSQPIWT